MSANSRFTLAVHALCWIELAARRGESPLSSERVAASLGNDAAAVRRLLAPLRDTELVAADRGPGGGWVLTRPAEAISLEDVWSALDELDLFSMHTRDPNLECPVGHGIRPTLAEVYQDVDEAVRHSLRTRTVAGLLDTILDQLPLPGTEAGASPGLRLGASRSGPC